MASSPVFHFSALRLQRVDAPRGFSLGQIFLKCFRCITLFG
jgi:hypothetical protein